jgi:hypothetical protein
MSTRTVGLQINELVVSVIDGKVVELSVGGKQVCKLLNPDANELIQFLCKEVIKLPGDDH